MKNLTLFLALSLSIVLIIVSCEKDVVSPTPTNLGNNTNPTPTSQITKFFDENLEDEIEIFNETSSPVSQIITTENNLMIQYDNNTFTYSDGTPVNGAFTIEVVDALTKKEMMKINRPTFTNDGRLLVSGGIIYLNATQGNEQLSINDDNPVIVNIPTDTETEMDFFTGSFDENEDFGWDLSLEDSINIINNESDSIIFDIIGQQSMFSYSFTMDSIGWINCDFFYDSNEPQTGVNVVLPDGYNGSNTVVFIYYNDINSVANMDDYDNDSNFDLGNGYTTPIGMDISFVIISEVDGSFFYNIVSTTITDNHVENIDSLIEVDEDELQDIIDNI
jgi:hypothetical protein